jgi:hypothetical protein
MNPRRQFLKASMATAAGVVLPDWTFTKGAPAIITAQRKLIAMGDVRARNRRGAEPLHCAADGVPGSPSWDPTAQAAIVAYLIGAGADPNAVDKSGVTPLHRAVRTRCTGAVRALLKGGADARRRNKNGSTPMLRATITTGRGGSGSPESKAEQMEIERLLEQHHGATRRG